MPPNNHSLRNKILIASGLIAVLIILAMVWYVYKAPQAQVDTVKVADTGKVVTGFDPRLVIVKDAKIVSSDQNNVASDRLGNAEIYTTVYTTLTTATSLFIAYNNLLPTLSYKVIKSSTKDGRSVILAQKGVDSITITIVDEKTDRKVSVSVSKTQASI